MRYRSVIILAAVGLIGAVAFAGDEPASEHPTSPAATAALRKYQIAGEKAKTEYDRAMGAAKRQALSDLDAALKISMKDGNLKEAKRIDSVSSQIKTDSLISAVTPAHITGKWHVKFENGSDRTMQFDRDGTVEWMENGQKKEPTTIVRIGGDVLIQSDERSVERITPLGNRLLFEHFTPSTSYPKDFPAHFGIGQAVQ